MKPKKLQQAADTVLMIRPKHFGYNKQTEKTNAFQRNLELDHGEVSKIAIEEFDHFVKLLRKYGIQVIVFDDEENSKLPDSVFLNNWISTHHDGTIIAYSMCARNRKMEYRGDILHELYFEYDYKITRTLNLGLIGKVYLEGTGSLVFDHSRKVVYVALSKRTDARLALTVAVYLNYEPVVFKAVSKTGRAIYHTNIMLTVAKDFAVICAESIKDKDEMARVLMKLSVSGREVIKITYEQMKKFAGNMLQLVNKKGELITVMSKTAFESLTDDQAEVILKYSKILSVPVPVIETIGGGSVRCMLTEVFLPKETVKLVKNKDTWLKLPHAFLM